MKLILLGAPGAGKGTIAKLLQAKHGAVQISTGDILRGAASAGDDLGAQAAGYMQRGELVPDDLVLKLMARRLQQPDCARGFLLDGFPRTIPQAEALEILLKELDIELDLAVNIVIARDEVIARLGTRRTCENPDCQAIYNIKSKPPKTEGVCDLCGGAVVQRADETDAAIAQRLQTYFEKSAPLVGFYRERGVLFEVEAGDSEGMVGEIGGRLGVGK